MVSKTNWSIKLKLAQKYEPAGKNGLKLSKKVLYNKPLMMKDFRDEAGKILMETMDGL